MIRYQYNILTTAPSQLQLQLPLHLQLHDHRIKRDLVLRIHRRRLQFLPLPDAPQRTGIARGESQQGPHRAVERRIARLDAAQRVGEAGPARHGDAVHVCEERDAQREQHRRRRGEQERGAGPTRGLEVNGVAGWRLDAPGGGTARDWRRRGSDEVDDMERSRRRRFAVPIIGFGRRRGGEGLDGVGAGLGGRARFRLAFALGVWSVVRCADLGSANGFPSNILERLLDRPISDQSQGARRTYHSEITTAIRVKPSDGGTRERRASMLARIPTHGATGCAVAAAFCDGGQVHADSLPLGLLRRQRRRKV